MAGIQACLLLFKKPDYIIRMPVDARNMLSMKTPIISTERTWRIHIAAMIISQEMLHEGSSEYSTATAVIL